jgi:hypothetical protein
MIDPVIIERAELAQIVSETSRNAALLAINTTLKELGIRRNKLNNWISQNQASKMIGRRRLENGMKRDLIRFKKSDPENRFSRVHILRADVEKFVNDQLK